MKTPTHLTLTSFSGPFVTHGIDVYSPPDDDESLYIFAVNHLANPVYSILNGGDVPRARSQIEVFHHTIGTLEAKHLRSIRHQLIRTPNDIYVVDEQHFYVINDHFHRGCLVQYHPRGDSKAGRKGTLRADRGKGCD